MKRWVMIFLPMVYSEGVINLQVCLFFTQPLGLSVPRKKAPAKERFLCVRVCGEFRILFLRGSPSREEVSNGIDQLD